MFADTRIARLNGPVQFDGTVNQALLDGPAVTLVSQRLNDNAYQTVISDGGPARRSMFFDIALSVIR